jgi:hypothetical protein
VHQTGPLLDIRTYRLVPGSGAEFDRIFREHARPLLERHGIRVLAAGPSLVDDDLYTLVRSSTLSTSGASSSTASTGATSGSRATTRR